MKFCSEYKQSKTEQFLQQCVYLNKKPHIHVMMDYFDHVVLEKTGDAFLERGIA